jgi:hypothetical protein
VLAHDVHSRVGHIFCPVGVSEQEAFANVTMTVGKRKAGCKPSTREEVRNPNGGERDAHEDGRTADTLSKCNKSDINTFSEV